MKSKRSKACDIKPAVRKRVLERDGGCCILCGTPRNLQIAHFVARSEGGLGIEQNLVIACVDCHYEMDQTKKEIREPKRNEARCYLKSKYPDWDEKRLKYDKDSWKWKNQK